MQSTAGQKKNVYSLQSTLYFISVVLLLIVICNLQEARALLGKHEYQKRNIEAALHIFERIDIEVVTSMIKNSLARRGKRLKRHSQNNTAPMSIHAVGLLLEAFFLKAKSSQILGMFKGILTGCFII